MEFTYKDFGKVLELARMRQNLTQKDLEDMTGGIIKQPAISEIENGKGRITLKRFIDLCNYLKIRPEELLEPYLDVPLPSEHSDAIVDLYVIRIASILEKCPSEFKMTIVEVIECLLKYQHQLDTVKNNEKGE